MYNMNEKIIISFWKNRLSSECKAHGVKVCPKKPSVAGLSTDDERYEYAKSFADSVVRGTAGKVPRERLNVKVEKKQWNSRSAPYFEVTVSLLRKDENHFYRDEYSGGMPYLSFSLHDDEVVTCAISQSANYQICSTRTLSIAEPEKLGEILACLYETWDADLEAVKKSVAKAQKLQKVISTSLQAMIESHLKGTGLLWAISEEKNGKIEIYIKFTPRKVLSMTIDSSKFDNDFSKILEAIDTLDTLIRKKNVNITVRGEQYMIDWQGEA